MPSVSKNQAKAMWAAAAGRSNIGIPQKAGAEFAKAQHGHPVKDLPERVTKKADGGAVAPYPPPMRW